MQLGYLKRREFVSLLGGMAAWPLVARAQQSDRKRLVGVLMNNAESDAETKAQLAALLQELQRLGWSEDRNLRVQVRYAADRPDQYQMLAKELVTLQPDVIFGYTTPITIALQLESRTVPIVFAQVSDPVGSGVVASLARPGGNLTGLLLYEEGIAGKWVAMLKEIAPNLKRAALLANPKTTPYEYFVRSAEAVAGPLAIKLVPGLVESTTDIERVIATFAGPDGGLLVLPSGTTTLYRDLVIALAEKYRLPAVYPFRFYVTAGGLMSYSTDLVDQSRKAASYLDRILRGANPAELPVQVPTKYVTTVNLKAAKGLGLDVPPSLLVRADEVIE
jgi:putative tryptophan/tyrosine transport system substrate-binding protein